MIQVMKTTGKILCNVEDHINVGKKKIVIGGKTNASNKRLGRT